MISCLEDPYKLTEEDVDLFIHPKLKYIRLSGLDFGAFEGIRASAIQNEQLPILSIDRSHYTSKAFQQLVMPSTSLTRMTLCETDGPSLTYSIHFALLTHSAAT